MAAYATQQREPSARGNSCSPNRLELAIAGQASRRTPAATDGAVADSSILDQLLDHIANRLAAVITERLVEADNSREEWFDSRHAAGYLGVHRDTLRKLAAERAIPSEQDGRGCKLYSGALTWTRGGTVADGLATLRQR